jgi:hypothetical protein
MLDFQALAGFRRCAERNKAAKTILLTTLPLLIDIALD